MSEITMTKQDMGLIGIIKKTPPHFLLGIMLFAFLWLMSEYFVSRKEYEKDQSSTNGTLKEIRQDIKEILRNSR